MHLSSQFNTAFYKKIKGKQLNFPKELFQRQLFNHKSFAIRLGFYRPGVGKVFNKRDTYKNSKLPESYKFCLRFLRKYSKQSKFLHCTGPSASGHIRPHPLTSRPLVPSMGNRPITGSPRS